MGNLRSIVDDVKRSEDAILITKDPATFARIRRQITALASTSAILGKYIPRETSTDLSTAVFALRAATEAEMRALESDATNTADEISAQRSRPAILTIERVLQRTEARLRDETHDRVEQAASTTIDAQRFARNRTSSRNADCDLVDTVHQPSCLRAGQGNESGRRW
jgi:hypothetical protein